MHVEIPQLHEQLLRLGLVYIKGLYVQALVFVRLLAI